MKKTLFTSGLVIFLLLGLAATSFAGMGIPTNRPNMGTEAGADIVASEKAKIAAANFNYNATQLAQVGTEAGADVIASEKAKIAAKTFNYNAEHLAWVGTEAGYDPTGMGVDRGIFNAEPASEQVADKDKLDNKSPCRC